MVAQIPEGGAILVVHNRNMESYLNRMIHDMRGEDIRERCDIVIVIDSFDVDRVHRTFLSNCQKLTPKPVLVDHAFHNGVQDWRVHERLGEFMNYFENRYEQEIKNNGR